MTYTDQQLQLALSKMLSKKLRISAGGTFILWSQYDYGKMEVEMKVKETEWLHVCWLIEQSLTKPQCVNYTSNMPDFLDDNPAFDYVWHASWQQRAIALCKVKGIEIV